MWRRGLTIVLMAIVLPFFDGNSQSQRAAGDCNNILGISAYNKTDTYLGSVPYGTETALLYGLSSAVPVR